MEMLREAVPFLVGLVFPPVLMALMRLVGSGRFKIPTTFVAALIIGSCISLLMGELFDALPGAIMAIIIDTSLVYTGSQLAYHIFWKPVVFSRFQRAVPSEMQREPNM